MSVRDTDFSLLTTTVVFLLTISPTVLEASDFLPTNIKALYHHPYHSSCPHLNLYPHHPYQVLLLRYLIRPLLPLTPLLLQLLPHSLALAVPVLRLSVPVLAVSDRLFPPHFALLLQQLRYYCYYCYYLMYCFAQY